MKDREYKSILALLQEAIVVHARDSSILYSNIKAQKILGIKEINFLGKKSEELFQIFVDRNSVELKVEDFPVNIVLATKEKLRKYIVGIKRPDKNDIIWCKINATPLFTNSHKIDKVIVNFIEISERKKTGKYPIDVDEKFNQLIKNSFDIIVLLDSDGIQRFVSDSCEKILGYSPEELTNISVIDSMIHPDDQEKAITEFRNILNNVGVGGTQYRHKHKNGGWVYLEAFGSNQITNPSINAVVLNVRDITDRKIAEEKLMENEARLKELVATKDKFFTIIGHDLKSPFNSIVGFSDLLVAQIQGQDYQGIERYATIIQNSSQEAMNLLTNLLEWSRAQTGKVEFNPEYIELVSFINGVSNLFWGAAQQKSITISCELPHNMPVFADKAMLSTILRNLISNGLKFTNPGGKIVISTEQKNNEVVVSVADNGIGIKKENINKLFLIEESCSTVGTRNEKGTGLGLMLCKEFIEKHTGRLWVESEEGKGSIFNFTIPNHKE
ncbi:MAG: PAS domain-containing sensor histidine kinase [Prolixibacteraceae bacterium]|nr:PAS domain-containing sensor histidine kinase [Prolixibacteraceae bacterium]